MISRMSSKHVFWAAVALYGASLATPGFIEHGSHTSGPSGYVYGGEILYKGWLSLFIGELAWFANPIGFLALIMIRAKINSAGMLLSATAFALGLHSFLFTGYPADERGANRVAIDHLSIGFYLWELSFVLLLLCCLLQLRMRKT